MSQTSDQELRTKLVDFLKGDQAYMSFDEAVKDFPQDLINSHAPNVEYTFWHILEHIRISQWDILDFSRNPKYQAINWPKDYWPSKDAQATPKEWEQTIQKIKADTNAMIALIQDPKNNMFAPIPWGDGQHLAREAMLLANHNAYHIGEFAVLRQVMKAWQANRTG